MPFENFHGLKTETELLAFFDEYFHDAIPLIGADRLVLDFFKLKPQYLVQIKVYIYRTNSIVFYKL